MKNMTASRVNKSKLVLFVVIEDVDSSYCLLDIMLQLSEINKWNKKNHYSLNNKPGFASCQNDGRIAANASPFS